MVFFWGGCLIQQWYCWIICICITHICIHTYIYITQIFITMFFLSFLSRFLLLDMFGHILSYVGHTLILIFLNILVLTSKRGTKRKKQGRKRTVGSSPFSSNGGEPSQRRGEWLPWGSKLKLLPPNPPGIYNPFPNKFRVKGSRDNDAQWGCLSWGSGSPKGSDLTSLSRMLQFGLCLQMCSYFRTKHCSRDP